MNKKKAKGLSRPKKSSAQAVVSAAFQGIFVLVFMGGLGGMLLAARSLGIFFKS